MGLEWVEFVLCTYVCMFMSMFVYVWRDLVGRALERSQPIASVSYQRYLYACTYALIDLMNSELNENMSVLDL